MRIPFPAISGLILLICGHNAAADERLFQDAAEFDAAFPPLMVEVSIPAHGELLTGTWYTAAGAGPHPTIVTLHAFPGYEKNLDLAQSLRRVGFNVLYFDYRGTWGGPGEFSVASGYADAASAIAFVTNPDNAQNLRIDRSRISLLGHSFGAVAALDVGADHRAVRCVVSLAPEDMTLMIGTADARQGLARYTDNLRVVAGYSGQDLVDDHELFLSGVRAELAEDFDVVGWSGDVDEAIARIRRAASRRGRW